MGEIFNLKRLNLNWAVVNKHSIPHPLTKHQQTQLKRLLVRKSFKNSEQGKFKPDVSHFLPTSPVSVATLDFSSASVPEDYWIAGAVFSMAVTPGIMKP